MICANCNSEIRDGLVFCPKCGSRAEAAKPLKPAKTEGGPSWILFAIALVAIGAVFGGYEYYVYSKVKSLKETARQAYKDERFDQCITALRYVVRKNPKGSGESRILLAKCYLGNDEPDNAEKQMETASSWAKKDPDILAAWAEILYENEKYDEAEAKASQALKFQKTNSNALLFLGMSQIKTRHFNAARKNLEKALKGAKGESATRVYNALGKANYESGDIESAIEAYNKSLKIYANQYEPLMELAKLYQKAKDFGSCERKAKIALELSSQRKRSEDAKLARSLAGDCGAIAQMNSIKECIIKRRKVDREYIVLYETLNSFLAEVDAEPEEFIGSSSDPLAAMLDSSETLADKYRTISCKVDYKDFFITSMTTIMAQVQLLDATLRKLKDFIETQDSGALTEFRTLKKRVDRGNESIIGIWQTEEEKFGMESFFKDKEEGNNGKPPASTGM